MDESSSACLMRSFSQPSSTSEDPQEGDPIRRALTSSVSFGRFVSESLAWEKWSSFTQNRYLEEVEKHSKPGSVAEMKAYFEAHYKRKASQKAAAAASLEQQNATINDSILATNSNSPIELAQEKRLHVATEDSNLSVDECCQSSVTRYEIESDRIEATEDGTEKPTSVENQVESSILPDLLDCGAEDEQIYVTEQEVGNSTFIPKKVELSTLLEDAQCIVDQHEVKAPAQDTARMEVSTSSDKKKPAPSLAKSSGPRQESRLRPPLKPTTRVETMNGDRTKRTVRESVEKKRSIPKSIHMSIDFCSLVANKSSSPELQKINPRFVRNLSRTTRESTKQQSSIRASSTYGVSKHLSATPQPSIRRNKKVVNRPISQNKTEDRTSESLYMLSSISSTARRTNAEYHTVSASFNLRTEERAAKRKEMLQQKLSMEAAEKEPLQARAKGSIRKYTKDTRQSITSLGKANASFHQGTRPLHVQTEKLTRTQPCSPRVGRKQKNEALPTNNRPTWKHSLMVDNLKYSQKPPSFPTKSFLQENSKNENMSPNFEM